ncbi:MAG: MFS transporter [Candidatus Paracaedibacteraceae bacterium]|nr:MFS transporter [Candidatus Paracaedibacteraceae bacterium]
MTIRKHNAAVDKTTNRKSNGYAIWSAVALFFFYQYILRVSPSVMVNELRFDFSLTAEQFSYFGAFYLYAYSLLQIPVGLMVDKYGVKRVVLMSITLCVLSTILASVTHHLYMAYLSRILMGAGSACAFMCTLKIVVDYIPKSKNGIWMGATLTLGVAGALIAGKPLSLAMDMFGWRHALLLTTIIGASIFVFSAFILPREKIAQPVAGLNASSDILKGIREILSTRMVLIYAFLAVGLYTPLSVMADLWGVAYIMSKFGLDRSHAAEVSMMLYIGLCIGSLVLPYLAEKYDALNQTIRICIFGILSSLCAILFLPNLGAFEISILFLLLGLFCGAEMLCFTGVVRCAPAGKTGVTLGITNTANMLGGAFAQQIIGFLLDRFFWKGALDTNGHRFYEQQDYTYALASLIIILILCCWVASKLPNNEAARSHF